MTRLLSAERSLLPNAYRPAVRRRLNAVIGQLELDLSRSLVYFDTYMDVLTQRHPAELGALLAGCDVIAADALRRDHPALLSVQCPVVYCDRGFGASTLREGVALRGLGENPMPLIQIPYSRLSEKYNLTSILHEVGHEAMVRIGLRAELPRVLRRAAIASGAPAAIGDLFALWSSEIGPDLWGFCCSGLAATGTIQEFLALPSAHVFRVSASDPHPPPYVRALLSFALCREVWGRGPWDAWQDVWLENYPLREAPGDARGLLQQAARTVPRVAAALLTQRFESLGGRPLTNLFELDALNPRALDARVSGTTVSLRNLRPAAHFAVFRLLREQRQIGEAALDRLMTHWLHELGKKRQNSTKPV